MISSKRLLYELLILLLAAIVFLSGFNSASSKTGTSDKSSISVEKKTKDLLNRLEKSDGHEAEEIIQQITLIGREALPYVKKKRESAKEEGMKYVLDEIIFALENNLIIGGLFEEITDDTEYTKAMLYHIFKILKEYKGKYGKFPDDLSDLINKMPIMSQGLDPKGTNLDPWGNDYFYRRVTTKQQDTFILFSKGPDGVSRTRDDIYLPFCNYHLLKNYLLSVKTQAEQVERWIEALENPEWEIDRLKEENFKSKYSKYNFSSLLTPGKDFLGYIAPSFTRLKIKLTSVNKEADKQDQYKITGYSIVKNNKCDFEGIIKIIEIREYKQMHYGCDDEYKNRGIQSQGILLGKYVFKENENQKFSGIFEGIVTLNWYVDNKGNVTYDNIESFSDRYKNNQYVGTWRQYKGENKKVANWGEHRIPFSEDLDIGAGEFGVNPKYYEQGWQDFK